MPPAFSQSRVTWGGLQTRPTFFLGKAQLSADAASLKNFLHFWNPLRVR
jgi:hypothetical protein